MGFIAACVYLQKKNSRDHLARALNFHLYYAMSFNFSCIIIILSWFYDRKIFRTPRFLQQGLKYRNNYVELKINLLTVSWLNCNRYPAAESANPGYMSSLIVDYWLSHKKCFKPEIIYLCSVSLNKGLLSCRSLLHRNKWVIIYRLNCLLPLKKRWLIGAAKKLAYCLLSLAAFS